MDAKKKKTYGIVLLVGLGALLVDRFLVAEPSPVAARTVAPAGATADAPDPIVKASSVTGRVAAAPFPRDLPAPEGIELLRDAFALTPAAREAMLGDSARLDAAAGPRADRQSAALEFQKKHRLLAVMTGPDTRVAIVDDEWVRVGQAVDGCRLLEIMGQTALFECGDGRAELVVSTLSDDTPDR